MLGAIWVFQATWSKDFKEGVLGYSATGFGPRTTEFELSQLGQARRGLSVQLTKGGESRKA